MENDLFGFIRYHRTIIKQMILQSFANENSLD